MKLFNNLPIYELTVNDDPETGVFRISIVDDPAIQENFICFSDTTKEYFTAADPDKHILYGPCMIPDLPIFRRDEEGREFYVVFSKETIREIQTKFHRDRNNFSLSLDHETPVDTCWIFQSFIIDRDHGINPEQFSNVPDGSWIIAVKVDDTTLWDTIKNTDLLHGFSVELSAIKNQDFERQKPVSWLDYLWKKLSD